MAKIARVDQAGHSLRAEEECEFQARGFQLSRYGTMKLEEIMALSVRQITAPIAHLYLWCPNALLAEGLAVMQAWGFTYKANIVWHKVRKDGGPDGRGVGFYFHNVTELILFGVRGKNARTLAPGRSQVNFLATRKREHSHKPDEQYGIIESCSPSPFLELFARGTRKGWLTWAIRPPKIMPQLGKPMPTIQWPQRSESYEASTVLHGKSG